MTHSARLVACLLFVWAASLAHADTVKIKVDKTATPGQLRVFWTGGTPTFTVYQSSSPSGVTNPANQLGTTAASEWFDSPAGSIAYYVVTTPCLAEPPAICCTTDNECLGSEFCKTATGQCTLTYADGDACGANNECSSGSCTDAVCCESACAGTCTSCNQVGLEGACSPFPVGSDPDAECPAVSCTGFYYGFVGDACHRRADVSAAQASCDGAGACQTAAQECFNSGQGPTTITCNAQCQDPTPGTCTGTTPGACTNVNPGNQTCGTGACQVTTAQCFNGVPNACVPNLPTTETCNGIDDNCDGTVDNGAFADGLEPSDSCAAGRTLNSVGEGQQLTVNPTLYPAGDVDIYRINTIENSGTCACCDAFCTDEDFRLIATLTVPVGAGSYEFCIAKDSCPGIWTSCQTIAAGSSNSWTFPYDGSCGVPDTNDGASFYVRIRGIAAPGFKCNTYSLQYRFEQGCFLP